MKNMHWKEYDIPAVIRRRADKDKALLAQDKQRAKILDPQWHYVPASETDVLATFKRMGWEPPTEVRLRAELIKAGWTPPANI